MRALSVVLFSLMVVIGLSGAQPGTYVTTPGQFPAQANYQQINELYETFEFPITSYSTFNPALTRQTDVGAPYEGYPDFGADLYRIGDGTYFGMSNSGPFTVCANNAEAASVPFPTFSPTATRFSFAFTSTATGTLEVTDRDFFWLRTRETTAGLDTATGLSPFTQYYNDTACSIPVPRFLGFNRSSDVGLDPGAFAVIKSRPTCQYFLIGEGYYPSIVLTDTSGLIRARFVPANYNKTQGIACLTPVLPAILSYVRRTKDIGGSGGFSGLALTNDDTVAWAIMRRPLGSDAADSTTRYARVHRVLRLDISDPLNPVVTGMFLYQTEPTGKGAECLQQGETPVDIKVTALVALTDSKFLVTERGPENSVVYEIDFTNATNVLNDAEANYQGNLILETRSHFNQTLNYQMPSKRKVVSLLEVRGINPAIETEGLTILGDYVLGFAESNRWTGPNRFRIHAVWLSQRLSLPLFETVAGPSGPFSGPRALQDATLAYLNGAPEAPALYEVLSAQNKQMYEYEAASASDSLQSVPHHVKLNFNFGGMVARAQ